MNDFIDIWNEVLGRERFKVYISPTQLSRWLKCPHLHYLTSISKEFRVSDSEYSIYGGAIHLVLAKIFLEKMLDQSSSDDWSFFVSCLHSQYDNALRDTPDLELDGNILMELCDNSKELLKDIRNNFEDKFGITEIISVEEHVSQFLFIKNDIEFILRGYIDLLFRDSNGEVNILDWKTCRDPWMDEKIENKKFQLVLYKEMVKNRYGLDSDEINCYYAFLTRNGAVKFDKVETNTSDLEKVLDNLHKMTYNAFERRLFIKKKTCKYCDCKKFYY